MGAPPFALSISHFVSSVGADAGFAAIIGLAILILLYFAQARETATLRDRFAEAGEQVRQLELRVAQLARRPAASPAAAGVAPRPRSSRPPPRRRLAPLRARRCRSVRCPPAPRGSARPR